MDEIKKLIREILLEKKKKRDRCLRIADRKYEEHGAYKSGAVVRCRQGDIWKDLKEELNNNHNQDSIKQVFENAPELSNIGTIEQYTKYLETIFPNSKVKDIVYHGGDVEEFQDREEWSYFTKDKDYASNYGNIKTFKINILKGARLNTISKTEIAVTYKDELKNFDGVIGDEAFGIVKKGDKSFLAKGESFAVRSAKQIYRLGSKQDIEGFKKYVKIINEAKKTNTLPEIINNFVNSEIGKKYSKYDCKSVTRAFVKWATNNEIKTKVINLAPPSAEFIKQNPKFKGKSGKGDGHIIPIVDNQAIDFTIRQFGINRPYENPLITSLNNLKSVYSKFGYYTDTPEWFDGGKSHWVGPLSNISPNIFNQEFGDEILENIKEDNINENWQDTSWENEKGQKITLPQLLDIIKNYPTIQAPIEKIKKIVIKKDSGGIESDRLSVADFKYPIIIIIDDNGDYKYIIDGNHRANKAIDAKLKSIPAKLVNVKKLPQKFQDILSEVKKETLRTWFKRQGPKGKEGGWVDCNAPDGKGGYKACGRKKGEERSKYPACKETPAQCKAPGKGKTWGKKQ